MPAWASGTDLWKDFTVPRGPLADPTDTHASTIYAPNAAGVYAPFAANVLTRTDLGLQTVPTRTNLMLRSQEFDNAAWGKVTASVTPDTVVAPDGTTTADTITSSGADATVGQSQPVATATVYTASVWLKVPSGTQTVNIYVNGAGGVLGTTVCNLTTSWQRFSVTGTTASTSNEGLQIGGASTFGNGVVLHVWQGQFEAGAFASPPIVTGAASATVNGNQQVIDLTGRLGTGVAGLVQFYNYANSGDYFVINDGGTSNYIAFYYSGGLAMDVVTGGVAQASMNGGAIAANSLVTVVFAVGTNYAFTRVIGATAPTADTSVTYPALTQVKVSALANLANNAFKSTTKLALSFGPQDATTFAAMYARGLLA